MPVYKLTYFGIKSRGEIVRLAFAAAGVKFEDYRISPATYLQDWPPIKASKSLAKFWIQFAAQFTSFSMF